MKKADLLLHPIRIRIVQSLYGGKQLTTQQIAEELSDVPQATLYRHLKKLLDHHFLEVIEERPQRGAIEKVYQLHEKNANISASDTVDWSKEDHSHAFSRFLTTLQTDFDRYLEKSELDLQKDQISYRQAAFYLDDQEMQELINELATAIQKRITYQPNSSRRRRLLTTILISDPIRKGDST